MWSYVVCNSLTGKRMLTVHPSDARWSTGMNTNIGTGEHTFQLRERRLPPATWRDLVSPWSRTLVSCWDDVPQHAGLITGSEYNRDNGALKVKSTELRSMLSRRLVTGSLAFARGGGFEVIGHSPGSAIAAVVRHGMEGTPGDGYHFPIVYPAYQAGGFSRRWPYFEFATIEDMVADIQNSDGAPDVYFRPRWSAANTLEWVLEVGPTGPTQEWVLGAEDAPTIGVVQKVDAATTRTGVVGLGKGTEHDMVLGFAGGLGKFPVRMDSTRSFKSVDIAAQVDALAMGALRAVETPTGQLALGSIPAVHALPDLKVGSTVRLLISGDDFMEDATRVLRVIGMSGGTSETLGVQAI